MTEPSGRALQRLHEAQQRGQNQITSHVRFHDLDALQMYVGLVRDCAHLAQLKLTEEGDRAAIRADYDLQRQRLEAEIRQVELAISQDERAFDALRQDNKDLINKLIEMNEISAAIELQRRFLATFAGSTLDKLLAARGGGTFVRMKTVDR